MISIRQEGNLIIATVMGEFTIADFKQLEQEIVYNTRDPGKIDLLIDLRTMLDYTLDVAVEELRFSRQHANDFRKIALVTEDEAIVWSAWLSKMFMDADIHVFDDDSLAYEWLEQA